MRTAGVAIKRKFRGKVDPRLMTFACAFERRRRAAAPAARTLTTRLRNVLLRERQDRMRRARRARGPEREGVGRVGVLLERAVDRRHLVLGRVGERRHRRLERVAPIRSSPSCFASREERSFSASDSSPSSNSTTELRLPIR